MLTLDLTSAPHWHDLSQAAAGSGPAVQALERLGLSASDLLTLPLDERVGAINAAIESFVPAAECAAVAGQLFGEEGSIAMSRIDTATLRQATEDVLAFGVFVSEQDADQIERTNDAISRLGLIWRGLSNQLAVAAAPALEAVANAMAAIASRTGPLGIAIRGLFDNIGRLNTCAATAAERFETALGDAGRAANNAGAAAGAAGAAAAAAEPNVETAVTGWQVVTAALSDYASKAREIGGDIDQSLVGAFQSAENAVGEFVKSGKLNFRDLVTSLLADLAQLAARRFILGPIANALSGVFSGVGGIFANVLHAGGMVGSVGPSRMVPAIAFAAAPRIRSSYQACISPIRGSKLRSRSAPSISSRSASVGTAGRSRAALAETANSSAISAKRLASVVIASLRRQPGPSPGSTGGPLHDCPKTSSSRSSLAV
ncbi:MAG: hypothetical protein MK098_08655 [Marinovum sp.]|nr:hypothetical protein [Marinovum sp.]